MLLEKFDQPRKKISTNRGGPRSMRHKYNLQGAQVREARHTVRPRKRICTLTTEYGGCARRTEKFIRKDYIHDEDFILRVPV